MAIFISYRRGSTSAIAGWLDDRLRVHFGKDQVFRDVDSIPLGEDFGQVISNAVSQCEVFLAIVGPDYFSERINLETDFVRLEIEAALSRKKHVIPVLVSDAALPSAASLPNGVVPILKRNATRLDVDRRFESDVKLLINGIEEGIRRAREQVEEERIARDKAEADRIAREKAETDRIAWERAETARIAHEKAEAARIARDEAEAIAVVSRVLRGRIAVLWKVGAMAAGILAPVVLLLGFLMVRARIFHTYDSSRPAAALFALVGFVLYEVIDRKPSWALRLTLSGLLGSLTYLQLRGVYAELGRHGLSDLDPTPAGAVAESILVTLGALLMAVSTRPILVRLTTQLLRRIGIGRSGWPLPASSTGPVTTGNTPPGFLKEMLGVCPGPIRWRQAAAFAAGLLVIKLATAVQSVFLMMGTVARDVKTWQDFMFWLSLSWRVQLAPVLVALLEPICILVCLRLVRKVWLAVLAAASLFAGLAMLSRIVLEPFVLDYLGPPLWHILDVFAYPFVDALLLLTCIALAVERLTITWKALMFGCTGALFLQLIVTTELKAFVHSYAFSVARTLGAVGVMLLAGTLFSSIVVSAHSKGVRGAVERSRAGVQPASVPER